MTLSESLQPHGGSMPPTHVRAALGGEEFDESLPHLGETNENPGDIGFFALLAEDLRTHEGDLFAQGFWALAVHRFGNWRMRVHPRILRLPLSLAYRGSFKLVEWTCGISLRYTVVVGRRVRIWHHSGMILGALRIGDDVHIRQNTTFGVAHRGDPRGRKPIIGNRVDIGAGAVVVGGITIGDDSVIGANAVVLQDVPPNSVAVGIPARILPRNPLHAEGTNHKA